MHPVTDLDDTVVLWRFIRLNTFLELFAGNFAHVRADAFDDPMEGAFGFRDVQIPNEVLQEAELFVPSSTTWKNELLAELRQRVGITCWFEFDEESYAMWRVYGRLGESVAVETTVGQLRRLLQKESSIVGRVQYCRQEGVLSDLRMPFFHKTPEYRYEREVRSIRLFNKRLGSRIYNMGVRLQDLDAFVNRIIVAPGNRANLMVGIHNAVVGAFNIAGLPFRKPIVASQLDRYLME